METKPFSPTTIDGVKRLAKKIKRQQQIPHHKALDEAAKAAGFENFKQANDHWKQNAKS